MYEEHSAPGADPGAEENAEHNAIIEQQHEEATESQPSLPEVDPIHEALLALLESNPDAIKKDKELRRIKDEHGVGLRALQQTYATIESNYSKSKQTETAAEPTTEEIQKKKEAEQAMLAEEEKITHIVSILKKQKNLVSVFHRLLQWSGYRCDMVMSASILASHGAILLPDSSAFFFTGSSASGKSAAIIKGSAFLPDEIVLNITSMSNMALQYIGDIKHKYVMFGEMAPPVDGQDDPRQMALRQLLSENKITHYTVAQIDKRNVAQKLETEGPCVAVATTTKDPKNFHDELQNRAVWVPSNDSVETTRLVLSAVADHAANPVQQKSSHRDVVLKAVHQFHRELKPLTVIIPFAEKIKPQNDHVTARRLFPMLLNLVKAFALLHQNVRERREINGVEVLVATEEDYRWAFEVLAPSAPRVLEAVPERARRAFDEVLKPAMQDTKPRSTKEIQQLLKQPDSTVRRWLKDYVEAGLLDCLDFKYGKQNVYSLSSEDTSHYTQDLGLIQPSRLNIPKIPAAQHASLPLSWQALL